VEITKQHANYVYDAAGNFERLNSGVLEYKNEFGEVRKESYGWVEAQKEGEKSGEKNYEWMKKTGDITDNIASRQQNYTKLLADAQKAMHDSASKTVHKSAGIQQVKDVQVANGKLKTSIDEVSAAIGRGQRPTKEQIDGLKNATLASKNAGRALSDLGKDANSWSHEMSVAIKRSIEWAAAMTLLYGSLRQIQQGIEFIKELNKEMVAIQTVTGATTEQVNAMKFAFNDLARETGATTQQVAQGSTEWFRQGKTMEETAELIRSTMVLSKLGNMEAAQATEYLTSMLNGFKLEAEDSMGVLDKIILLDNTLATSSAEVAEALSRSSNSAQQMGVTFDELASFVAVVSSVSRRSAESVGEAFNSGGVVV
jgi:soluble cytochrome b562